MNRTPWLHLERYRLPPPHGGDYGWDAGTFLIPHPATAVTLRIIASGDDGDGWEHVSVSLPNRTPNWREMEFVCRLFWTADETVMQLHPPRSEWINNHPFCLHLWKPTKLPIPRPPGWMVGIRIDPHNNSPQEIQR